MLLNFESIIHTLQSLYTDSTRAMWVQNRATLRARSIPDDEPLQRLVWTAVVFDAAQTGKLSRLINEALRDYPQADSLQKARQTLQLRQATMLGTVVGVIILMMAYLI